MINERWYGKVKRKVKAKRKVKLFDESFDVGVVPMDWRGARIVPLYKRKGDKCECSNSRGTSLFSIVGSSMV